MEDKVRELYLSGATNKTEIARIAFPELNLEQARGRVRKILKDISVSDINKSTPIKHNKNFVLSAWNEKTGSMMDIDEYCLYYGLPRDDVREYKLVTHTGTPYYNIRFKDNEIELSDVFNEDFLHNLIKKHLKEFKKIKKPQIKSKKRSESSVRAILTDVHIGMDPNSNGNSLFGGKWDENELMSRMFSFAEKIIENGYISGANSLFIDDLGDFLDGWEGSTARKGHELPQNMTTAECFDIGVKFKVNLVDIIVDSGEFSSITLNNVCNDNHAGVFGYVLNSAVKQILEAKYPKLVKVNNYQKFISHYTIGDHCFMLCHGKDDRHLKFGFKPHLDDKGISKIDQYMKVNGLYGKSKWFEFSKGDSHLMLFDYSTSDDFNYMNYPAFSPSSDWVQTNFKRGNSGFVIQTVPHNNREIKMEYKLFNWIE